MLSTHIVVRRDCSALFQTDALRLEVPQSQSLTVLVIIECRLEEHQRLSVRLALNQNQRHHAKRIVKE